MCPIAVVVPDECAAVCACSIEYVVCAAFARSIWKFSIWQKLPYEKLTVWMEIYDAIVYLVRCSASAWYAYPLMGKRPDTASKSTGSLPLCKMRIACGRRRHRHHPALFVSSPRLPLPPHRPPPHLSCPWPRVFSTTINPPALAAANFCRHHSQMSWLALGSPSLGGAREKSY